MACETRLNRRQTTHSLKKPVKHCCEADRAKLGQICDNDIEIALHHPNSVVLSKPVKHVSHMKESVLHHFVAHFTPFSVLRLASLDKKLVVGLETGLMMSITLEPS